MIKFLIVLYNKSLCECETCSSILGWKQELRDELNTIYIWNNSVVPLPPHDKEHFESYFPKTDIEFFEDGNNHPLSEVYNTIIEKTGDEGVLVLWDHDSKVREEYINNLLDVLSSQNEVNLCLPQVYYQDQLVSPGWMCYFWGRTLKSIKPGLRRAKNLTGINSGMAIRCSYLKNEYPGYNPDIKFYGTDNDFMYKYRLQNKYLYILPVKLEHELNSYSKTDLDDNTRRYHDIKNGIFQLSRGFPLIIRCLSHLYVFCVSTKLNIQNKTNRFWR